MHNLIDALTNLIKAFNELSPNALLGFALFVILITIWVLGRR